MLLQTSRESPDTDRRQGPQEGEKEIFSVRKADGDCCYPKVVSNDGIISIDMKIDDELKRVSFPEAIEIGIDYDLHIMMCNATETNGSLAIAEETGFPQV